MLHRMRPLLALALVALLMTACSPDDIQIRCDRISFRYQALGFPVDTFSVTVTNETGDLVGSGTMLNMPADAFYTFVLPITPAQPDGTLLRVSVEGTPLFSIPCVADVVPQTSFNPGDGRVDPQPGDRIALYCHQPGGSLDVWGVADDSRGFRLATVEFSALAAAGLEGLSVTNGENGTISVSMDGQGNLWAAWNGGRFAADGQPGHGFAKGFRCD